MAKHKITINVTDGEYRETKDLAASYLRVTTHQVGLQAYRRGMRDYRRSRKTLEADLRSVR